MIVQTAPDGAPRFVIPMSAHMALAEQFARAFGNDAFEQIANDEIHYIIANHDAGWRDLDAEFRIDPDTGYPYNLTETPFEFVEQTSTGSPDFNEAHHPLSGLLSSMHTWGLYNGRYGLSDIVLLDKVGDQNKPRAEAMLAHEIERQERLKQDLSNDPGAAPYVADDRLMQAYKLLQFCDTLALYFNRIHEGAREPSVFPSVPMSATEDVDVTVAPEGDGVYAMSPWPFAGDRLTASFDGRYMEPVADGRKTNPDAAEIDVKTQTVTLRKAP
jgi:hypothetical protein